MSSLTDAGIKSLNCPPSPASPSLPSTPPIQPPDAAVIGGGGSSGGSSGGMISIGGPISGGGTTTTPSADPWASLTWEERILALKDQAREADRALWESGGSIALYICASF